MDEAIQRWVDTKTEWAVLDGEATELEDLTKTVIGELVNQSAESSVGRAEHDARASLRLKDHLRKKREARTAANIKRAELDGMTMTFEAWRTRQATRRAEMNLR